MFLTTIPSVTESSIVTLEITISLVLTKIPIPQLLMNTLSILISVPKVVLIQASSVELLLLLRVKFFKVIVLVVILNTDLSQLALIVTVPEELPIIVTLSFTSILFST